MPMNTPHAKNPVVASCSHSHGLPMISRVTTSQKTESVNPAMDAPQSTIRTYSKGSSAFHFKWRWLASTSIFLDKIPPCLSHGTGGDAIAPPPVQVFMFCLLHVADKLEDLDRMRAQFLGELILNRCGGFYETGFVDAFDHLHA